MQGRSYVLQNVTTRGRLLLDTTHRRIPDAFIAFSHARISSVGSFVVYGTIVLSKSIIKKDTPRFCKSSGVRLVNDGKMTSGMREKDIADLPNSKLGRNFSPPVIAVSVYHKNAVFVYISPRVFWRLRM